MAAATARGRLAYTKEVTNVQDALKALETLQARKIRRHERGQTNARSTHHPRHDDESESNDDTEHDEVTLRGQNESHGDNESDDEGHLEERIRRMKKRRMMLMKRRRAFERTSSQLVPRWHTLLDALRIPVLRVLPTNVWALEEAAIERTEACAAGDVILGRLKAAVATERAAQEGDRSALVTKRTAVVTTRDERKQDARAMNVHLQVALRVSHALQTGKAFLQEDGTQGGRRRHRLSVMYAGNATDAGPLARADVLHLRAARVRRRKDVVPHEAFGVDPKAVAPCVIEEHVKQSN